MASGPVPWGSLERLGPECLDDITCENEKALATVRSPDGLIRADGDDERRVELPVLMVVTDARLVFVPADATGAEEAGALAYGDLAGVSVADSLVLRSVEEVTWQLPVEVDEPTAAHLEWVSDVRERVTDLGNDLDRAAELLDTLTGERAWEDAEEVYERHRGRLDRLLGAVQRSPLPDDRVAPELTPMERTLERAYAWLYIARAESQVDHSQGPPAEGPRDRPTDPVAAAREFRDRARSRVEESRRPDRFHFGEERELEAALDQLDLKVETAAVEAEQSADDTPAPEETEPGADGDYYPETLELSDD